MEPDDRQSRQIRSFLNGVETEVYAAVAQHAPMNSLHEGYAVLLEEVDELWTQVKLRRSDRDLRNVLTELKQIAAMATRCAVDVVLPELHREFRNPEEEKERR